MEFRRFYIISDKLVRMFPDYFLFRLGWSQPEHAVNAFLAKILKRIIKNNNGKIRLIICAEV